eukprot:2538115-Prymnesium_polylepis.2
MPMGLTDRGAELVWISQAGRPANAHATAPPTHATAHARDRPRTRPPTHTFALPCRQTPHPP